MSNQIQIPTDQHSAMAKERLAYYNNVSETLTKVSEVLAEDKANSFNFSATAAPVDNENTATGHAQFTGIIVWERLAVFLDFNPRLRFDADLGGLALSLGGVVFGRGWFSVPPSELIGEAVCQVVITLAAVEISWWRDGKPLGVFVGGGPSIGVATIGGSGKFSND